MYETLPPIKTLNDNIGVPNYADIIAENIKVIELDLKFARNNIENLNVQVVSKPLVESVRSTLQNIFDTVISTEKLFSSWNKEALKSSDDLDKLNELESTFKKLVEKVQAVSTYVKKAAHDVSLVKSQSLKSSITATSTLNNTLGHSFNSYSTVNLGLSETYGNSFDSEVDIQDSPNFFQYDFMQNEEYPLLEDTIVNERKSGIKRISGQVSKINQMFNSLSSIIIHQGEDIDLIHNTVKDAKKDSLETLDEIDFIKKFNMKNTKRLLLFFVIILIICFAIIKFI